MADQPIGHHTVPKFYLRRFARSDALTAVSIATGARFGTNVADATTENHFYRVPAHPTNSLSFEEGLAQAEGAASAIYRDIDHGLWPLTADKRLLLAEFLTLQFLRGQAHRRQIDDVVNETLRRMQIDEPDRFAEVMRLPGAPDATALRGPVPPSVSSAVHIQQIITLLPQLVKFIAGRIWVLSRFDEASLITSDEPITPLQNPRTAQDVALGLNNAFALLHPLSRELGLTLYRPPGREARGQGTAIISGQLDTVEVHDAEMARIFNRSTAAHAHRFAYSHPEDTALIPTDIVELAMRGGRVPANRLPDAAFASGRARSKSRDQRFEATS